MRLSEINIYPVKSLKGISLQEATVEDRGLRFDRRWMVVDEKGKFLTQREYPVMALINVGLQNGSLLTAYGEKRATFAAAAPGLISRRVSIWKSSVKAVQYPAEVGAWFSDVLQARCELVLMPEESKRAVNPFYAVRRFKDIVSFADGYPFMLVGQASLDDLNSRLEKPLPMNRFRPNFVFEGSEPFAEDTWKRIRMGPTVFHVVKACERCIIPTIDQSAGKTHGPEPLKTLASYRKKGSKILFGQNLIAEEAGGVVSVGDAVAVLETI